MATKTALVTAPHAVRALRFMSLGFLVAAATFGITALATPPGTFELAPAFGMACVFGAFFAFLPTAKHAPEGQLPEPTRINPATGLPMVGNGTSVDVGGNPYGASPNQQPATFYYRDGSHL